MVVLNLFTSNQASVQTILYSAFFCPFAQRAWCALNELGVSYDLIESLTDDPTTKSYIKHEDLLKANPKGLVPTLVQREYNEKDDPLASFREVVVCDSMEILHELYRCREAAMADKPDYTRLENLYQEAMDWNKAICSTSFYAVLMKQEIHERNQAWEALQQGLYSFSEHLQTGDDAKNDVSFYTSEFAMGVEPSLVDFVVFPFVHRLYIIEHYKGLKLPESTDVERKRALKIMCWMDKMEKLPSVQTTLAKPADLIPIYLRYADGTTKSKVGDSIRQGTNVHDV